MKYWKKCTKEGQKLDPTYSKIATETAVTLHIPKQAHPNREDRVPYLAYSLFAIFPFRYFPISPYILFRSVSNHTFQ
jgi:hypothetical protein